MGWSYEAPLRHMRFVLDHITMAPTGSSINSPTVGSGDFRLSPGSPTVAPTS